MFKSKKWIFILFIVIALPILIINLPFLTKPQYSNDGKFILEHQDSIKKKIIENLDFEKKRIKSVTLLPGSASGEYDNGGDVSGNYHIYFSAYVNDNKEQSLRAELSFPDAGIAPFTFIHPNPYKDKSQDMSTWYMGEIEISEDSSWDWKREQDEAKKPCIIFRMLLLTQERISCIGFKKKGRLVSLMNGCKYIRKISNQRFNQNCIGNFQNSNNHWERFKVFV